MSAKNNFLDTFKIGMSSRYRIRVVGGLDTGWSDRLAGMAIETVVVGGRTRITTLSGNVMDQAALTGVLNTLYELHLPLLSVENLDETGGGGDSTS